MQGSFRGLVLLGAIKGHNTKPVPRVRLKNGRFGVSDRLGFAGSTFQAAGSDQDIAIPNSTYQSRKDNSCLKPTWQGIPSGVT